MHKCIYTGKTKYIVFGGKYCVEIGTHIVEIYK